MRPAPGTPEYDHWLLVAALCCPPRPTDEDIRKAAEVSDFLYLIPPHVPGVPLELAMRDEDLEML